MPSLTQWTWVWMDSGCLCWTGRPGVLRFMGSQRVGHDWVTELNWNHTLLQVIFPTQGWNPGLPPFRQILYQLSHQGSDKDFPCQYRRLEFDPQVGKIPWRRKLQFTPIFLPGKSHRQKSLASYSPSGFQRVAYDWTTKQQQNLCSLMTESSLISAGPWHIEFICQILAYLVWSTSPWG